MALHFWVGSFFLKTPLLSGVQKVLIIGIANKRFLCDTFIVTIGCVGGDVKNEKRWCKKNIKFGMSSSNEILIPSEVIRLMNMIWDVCEGYGYYVSQRILN